MKVSFVGNFSDPGFEGLMSIKNKLKNFLQKHKFKITENKKGDFYHIHSGGFLPAMQYQGIGKKCLYTLYSNINTSLASFNKSLVEQYAFLNQYNKKRKKDFMRRVFFSMASSLIPVATKRSYLKKMRTVVVPTQYMKSILKIKNCEVIPIGIDITKFKKTKKKGKKFSVAYIGHAGATKGFPDVINVFKQLPKDIEKNIYFSKDANLFKHLEKDGITVHGYVKSIVDAYNENDVILLPYRTLNSSIGNPLVLLEAMACERAIVTTDLPHIKETSGGAAILVKPYDIDAMVQTIEDLRENQKRRTQLGKKARNHVIKNHNEKDMLNKYLKLYKSLR